MDLAVDAGWVATRHLTPRSCLNPAQLDITFSILVLKYGISKKFGNKECYGQPPSVRRTIIPLRLFIGKAKNNIVFGWDKIF